MPLLALHRWEVRANVKKAMAPKFVIARALCARGNLGKAVAFLLIAFP